MTEKQYLSRLKESWPKKAHQEPADSENARVEEIIMKRMQLLLICFCFNGGGLALGLCFDGHDWLRFIAISFYFACWIVGGRLFRRLS